MKNWKKRMLCLLCALLLTVQLCPVGGNTVLSGVCLIAVGDDLMEPKQETMPFWKDNRLYVPETVFRGIYRDSLGVFCAIGYDRSAAILYRYSDGKYITFEIETGKVYDGEGNTYPISAVEKNGYVFFPITQVTEFFDLTYSYTPTETVPLLRIKSDTTILNDQRFIDAARNLMRQYYNRYEKQVLANQTPNEDPDTPPVKTGQRIYLTFTVTDAPSAKILANTLFRRDMQATFLLTPEQMEQEAELLRTLVGMKHGIAICPDGESEEPLEQQLQRANTALWAAARSSTRVVWLDKDADVTQKELDELGYCRVNCRIDAENTPLTSSTRAEAVYKRIGAVSDDMVTVFLGEDQANTVGLGRLLTQLSEADSRVLAWRETL